MTENIAFEPQFYYVNGEYIVNRLFNAGTSTFPTCFSVKEVDLKKIYGLSDKDIDEIPAYVDYAMDPENDPVRYNRVITMPDGLKYLNMYELPFHPEGGHQVIDNITNWPNILKFLLHIAPNEKPFPTSKYTYFELMLDYLAYAWRAPKINLPILALVSKERSTGKTTFLELIQLMFQTNARWVKERDLDSEFNRFWGFANFILVDEAQLPRKLMNRIRSESTASTRSIHEKYQTKSYIANYSKFIMTSNDIDNFAHIDPEENRYFIIEVAPLPAGTEDRNFSKLIQKELPNFLDYLKNHHQIQSGNETRMTFNYDDYKTPALDRLINGSISSVFLKVEEGLQILAENSLEYSDEVAWEFTVTNFREWLQFDKGKEGQIKNAFKRLGVQSSESKKRFICAISKCEVNAIKNSITVGQLKTLFNINVTPEYVNVN